VLAAYWKHSTDGGETWALQDTSYSSGISFVDAKTGWTVGYGVRRTTDGGETWTTRQPAFGSGIFFIDANTGFTAWGGCGAETPCRGGIYKTIDGGESWTNLEFGGVFTAVFFSDPKIGTAVGGFRTLQQQIIYRTTDGGETWHRQTGGGYRLQAVAFVDANIGTAVGIGGTILHTTTGGD